MSTASTTPTTLTQQLIDQRLDAIDQNLLGLLPRSERLELVQKVEGRLQELATSDSTVEAALRVPVEPLAATSVPARAARRGRSRMALTAGVLGIVALVLLFISPIVYLVAATLGEAFDETITLALLGAYMLALTVGGTAAVAFGVISLVRLARSRVQRHGHGWAITGLCTGPLPMFAGGLLILVFGMQLLASDVLSNVVVSTMPTTAGVACSPSGSCDSFAVAPASPSVPVQFAVRDEMPAASCGPAAELTQYAPPAPHAEPIPFPKPEPSPLALPVPVGQPISLSPSTIPDTATPSELQPATLPALPSPELPGPAVPAANIEVAPLPSPPESVKAPAAVAPSL